MPFAIFEGVCASRWIPEAVSPEPTPSGGLNALYWKSPELLRQVELVEHSDPAAGSFYWVSKQPDPDHDAPVVLTATPLGDERWGIVLYTLSGCYATTAPTKAVMGGVFRSNRVSLARVQKLAVEAMREFVMSLGDDLPLRVSGLDFQHAPSPLPLDARAALREFRQQEFMHTRCCKIGVLLQRSGQMQENEFYCNTEHPANYQHFLDWLGEPVALAGYRGYRGGLDVQHGQTGERSLVLKFTIEDADEPNRARPVPLAPGTMGDVDEAECVFSGTDGLVGPALEIMFHVATMMPTSETDLQQVEKKRHIGNDGIVIVFSETPDDMLTDTTLTSKMLMALITVWPAALYHDDTPLAERRYCFRCLNRRGVPQSTPLFGEKAVPLTPETREAFVEKLLGCRMSLWTQAELRMKLLRMRRGLLTRISEAQPS